MNIAPNGSFPVSWPALSLELGDSPLPTQLVHQFLAHTPQPRKDVPPADRYVLTSNLHKAVRFGRVNEAAATAEALFRCDPVYFYRRLPVVAFEDVSLGNLGACLEILTWCRNLPLRRKFEGMGLPGYLGSRLAATPKCRNACDLLCLVETQHGLATLGQEIAGMDTSAAVTIASTAAEPLRRRAIALLRLERLPIRGGDQRAEMLLAACRELRLPEQVTQAVIEGKGSDCMSTFIPLILELMANRPLRIEERALESFCAALDGPILCAALDKHTRLGQRAIKDWLRNSQELTTFFSTRTSQARPEKILGVALFHVESSLLDRRLTNDCLDLLRAEYERSDMASFGLGTADAAELYGLMRRNHAALNEIRKQLWTRK